VYRFLNQQGEVLYVGKSKDLRSRLKSYYNDDLSDRPWISIMRRSAHQIAMTITEDEQTALILEADLIREHRPKYNLKLTDDKSYPYIMITIHEAYPRLAIVRRPKEKRATYFGPYLSAHTARLTCELLRKAYGIHLSNRKIIPKDSRPCLNCQLEGNLCPLANEISPESYQLAVGRAVRFLSGHDNRSLIKELKKKMTQAAEEENFELARNIRDRITAAQEILNMPRKYQTDDYNVIASAQEEDKGAVAVFEIRDGKIANQKSYQLDGVFDTNQLDERFIIDYYRYFHRFAGEIVLEKLPLNTQLVVNILTKQANRKTRLLVPQRGAKRQMLRLAKLNAEAALKLKKDERSQVETALWELKELLGIKKLPARIEAVDVSNLGTQIAVGSVVTFLFGRPAKQEYRRYNIKTVRGQNDFAMIAEVVKRRLKDPTRNKPDILLIDGGPEQLSFAIKAAGDSIGSTKIIALAKKPDRIYLPHKKSPLNVVKHHTGLRLLSNARDEAHRLAVGFQRSKRKITRS